MCILQAAYTMLGKSQTATDQLLMHYTTAAHNTSWRHLNLTTLGGALGGEGQTMFLLLDGECFVDYFRFLPQYDGASDDSTTVVSP